MALDEPSTNLALVRLNYEAATLDTMRRDLPERCEPTRSVCGVRSSFVSGAKECHVGGQRGGLLIKATFTD